MITKKRKIELLCCSGLGAFNAAAFFYAWHRQPEHWGLLIGTWGFCLLSIAASLKLLSESQGG